MRTILNTIAGGLALALAASGAFAQDDTDSFNSPTGNISCHFTPRGELPSQKAGLHCDRFAPGPVRVLLGESGKAGIERNVKDACCEDRKVLAYGTAWHGGPFTCVSAREGITCTGPNGHGFFLSRARIDAY